MIFLLIDWFSGSVQSVVFKRFASESKACAIVLQFCSHTRWLACLFKIFRSARECIDHIKDIRLGCNASTPFCSHWKFVILFDRNSEPIGTYSPRGQFAIVPILWSHPFSLSLLISIQADGDSTRKSSQGYISLLIFRLFCLCCFFVFTVCLFVDSVIRQLGWTHCLAIRLVCHSQTPFFLIALVFHDFRQPFEIEPQVVPKSQGKGFHPFFKNYFLVRVVGLDYLFILNLRFHAQADGSGNEASCSIRLDCNACAPFCSHIF